MTKIRIEILDNDAIDCDYYGDRLIGRIIQLSKPNGERQRILDQLHQKIQRISLIIEALATEQTRINNLTTQIKRLTQTILSDQLQLTTARKAVKQVQPNFDVQSINNPAIEQNAQAVQQLTDQVEKAKHRLTRLQIAYATNCAENPLSETIEALINQNISITDQTVFNTVIGATMLYDAFIDDGWTVDNPFDDTINHLNADLAYTDDESIIPTPQKPAIYRSKHNQ